MAANDLTSTRLRLRKLAWLLDNSIPIPGLRFRIGLDALIGLIPGLGDLAGVLLSTYIVGEAARAGVSKSVLLRMMFNVAVEGVVGMIPFAGDVFDAVWKTNQRNVALLDAWLTEPQRTRRTSSALVFSVLCAMVALLAAMGVAGFYVLRWFLQALGA